jgi:tetratricopeptide (TPR) repeat protein
MLLGLGALKSITSRLAESAADLAESRRIAVELDERELLTSVLISAAAMWGVAGNARECVWHAEQALNLVEQGVEQGERRRLGVLNVLGTAYVFLGRLDEAFALFLRAKELASGASVVNRASADGDLGLAHLAAGNAEQALASFTASVATARGHMTDDNGVIGMARAHSQLGAVDQAIELATAVLRKTRRQYNTRFEAECCVALGAIYSAAGKPGLALDFYRMGHDMARKQQRIILEIEALTGVGLTARESDTARQAVELARTHGLHLYHANALNALAEVMLVAGEVTEARAAAEEALSMHRMFGARLGEAKALALLERTRAKPDATG